MSKRGAPILVLQHDPALGLGALQEPLEREGVELHTYHLGHHEPPDPELADAFGAIISLPGPQRANEADADPFLARELDLLRVAVREDVPVLGIVLGAKMLARALGATVRPAPKGPEIGWRKAALTPRARAEPLLKGFHAQETVFLWHQEAFDLPRDARLLVTGERTERLAFAHGATRLGLLFHIEADARAVDARAGDPGHEPVLRAAGTSLREISDGSLVNGSRQATLAQVIARRYALMARGLRPDQSGPIRV